MVELVPIQKYLHEFHDGCLIDIEHKGRNCVLSLESAEMDPADMKDGISLSGRGTIKGKLYVKDIQSININEVDFQGKLSLKYDYGSIFDFDIQNDVVELQISWRNSPGKPNVNDFSTIKIKAKSIFWETIPDLEDPFW